MALKRFKYLKKGETISTDRVVYQVHPGGHMLSLDVSEYSEEVQLELDKELTALSDAFTKGIADLGLKNNYRYFKKECIQKL